MKDEYGSHPICCNDIRRRPDLVTNNNRNHKIISLQGARCSNWGWVKPDDVYLCINCSSYIDGEGEFLNTI